MRLFLLLFTALLTATVAAASPTAAQDAQPSSKPSTEDGSTGLPVSLDRIREGLATAPAKPLLSSLERPPDFKVEVEERTITDILSTLDFKTGPAPAGGLYGYEQQQRLFSPVDRPLAQPYAAFSSSELITIAIQNLIFKYLGGRIGDAVSDAERARAEAAARGEVTGAIAKYCAADPERAKRLSICTR